MPKAKHLAIVMATATALLTVCVLTYSKTRERGSAFESLLLDYHVVDSKFDQRTKKIVELGGLTNATTLAYELGVFDTPNPNRSMGDVKSRPVMRFGNVDPWPQAVEFDGKCYFVRGQAFYVKAVWQDQDTGTTLCFYALSPNGTIIMTD